MNYHNIKYDDMNNGSGLRVTLFVSGCDHFCNDCQNPQTWDIYSGIPFHEEAEKELFDQLDKDYISGITFSGGDPLNENNIYIILELIKKIRFRYENKKTIWVYTGYTFEELQNNITGREVLSFIDVLVDGEFKKDLADVNYHWAGSTNQRVIDVDKSLKNGKVILYKE